jgi:hypothetical protein
VEKLEHRFKRRHISTDLSWEQKNPMNYLFRPSKAILRLEGIRSRELWSCSEINRSKRRKQQPFSGKIIEKKAGRVKGKKSVQRRNVNQKRMNHAVPPPARQIDRPERIMV